MKRALTISNWSGGVSFDDKVGPKHSVAYAKGVDFRKHPTLLTSLPTTRKESASTVVDLVVSGLQMPSGLRYFTDLAGNIYARSTAGSWSKNATNVGTHSYGMSYILQQDAVYISNPRTLSTINYADGILTPSSGVAGVTVTKDAIGPVVDQTANSAAAAASGTQTTVTETANEKVLFTPTAEPLYSIKIWVVNKGTGNLTIDVHDAQNNRICTSTILNASLTNGAFNEFVMTTPGRLSVKPNAQNYHFHIYSNVGGGGNPTIQVTTINIPSTVNMQTWADRFIQPKNGMHPMINFLQYILIGNERYVAAWEPITQTAPSLTEFHQHRLFLPPGYEVCGFAFYNEFVAIAAEKRSSSTLDFQDGKIFLWDGISTAYNSIIDVPDGSPYGLFSYRNTLYWEANGTWFTWGGTTINKIRRFPGTDLDFSSVADQTIVYPSTGAVRNGVLLVGYPSQTTNTNIEHGVYSYGRQDPNFPMSFGYDFQLSTGTLKNSGSNNLRIGMVKNFGDSLFISWRDTSTYGVDVVDNSSTPSQNMAVQSLIFDNGVPWKQKEAFRLKVNFKTLPTGATVTPKYKLERASSWTLGTAATATATTAQVDINTRFRELEFGFDMVGGTTLPVEVISMVLEFDDLVNENAVG